MAEKIGISHEKFREICPLMVKYNLLNEETIAYDDRTVTVYSHQPQPEIRPLLMLAYQFIHARTVYYNFSSQRNAGYLDIQ